METVEIDAVAPATDGRGRERRGLTGALGTEDLAVNHYTLEPGERVSGLHAHGDQEEVFLVLAGAVTFETYRPDADEPAREVAVGAGEAVRFAPGEYQSALNDGEGTARLYALGAPRDSEDLRIPLACPDCGHAHVAPALAGDRTPVLACPDCGAETPVECPGCGGDDLHAVLGEGGEPVSRCRDCGHVALSL